MEVRVRQPIKGWCETQRGQRVATPGMLSPLCSVHTPFLIQQSQVMTLSQGVFPWQGRRTDLKTYGRHTLRPRVRDQKPILGYLLDGGGDSEPADAWGGELPRVKVGNMLHGLIQLSNTVSLQGQYRLTGACLDLKSSHQRERRGQGPN